MWLSVKQLQKLQKLTCVCGICFQLGGQRNKLKAKDGNEIDTMFIDRRNNPEFPNGNTLVCISGCFENTDIIPSGHKRKSFFVFHKKGTKSERITPDRTVRTTFFILSTKAKLFAARQMQLRGSGISGGHICRRGPCFVHV